MKRLSSLMAVLALVASMLGCSKSPEPEPETKVQLRLSGSINAVTRVNGSGFESNDPIGVYVAKDGALTAQHNYLDNAKFSYEDGDILAPMGTEVYWGFGSNPKLSVYAYYPYLANIASSNAVAFSANTDQSTADNFYDSDFLFAKAENLAPQSTPVKLAFDHMLSRINVYITMCDGFTSEDYALIESVKIKNLATGGTISLIDGSVTTGETKSVITPFARMEGAYSAIVFPQKGDMVVEVTMNGKVYQSTVNVDLASKYQYDYYFTISMAQTALLLATTTINGWGWGGSEIVGDMTTFGEKFNNFLMTAEQYVEQDGVWVSNGIKIDTNGDGIICDDEALAVKGIHIPEGTVDDLTGIERFLNLESLSCGETENGIIDTCEGTVSDITLTKLDVSKNTKLRRIIINCNRLRELDVTMLPDLETLCFYKNHLAEIDVTHNPKLKKLDMGYNEITTVDISQNPLLERISLWDCPISEITGLDNTPSMKAFVMYRSNLTELDLSKCTDLEEMRCTYNSNLATMNLSGLNKLEYADCAHNKLNQITLPSADGNLLNDLWVNYNELTSIDVSKNTNLIQLVCDVNKLSALDVTKNTKLERLFCETNEITELDLSKNTALDVLSCYPMNEDDNLLEFIYSDSEEHIVNMTRFEKPAETEVRIGTSDSYTVYDGIIPDECFDATFLNYLKNNIVCFYNSNNSMVGYCLDKNKDGKISYFEAKNVTILNVDNMGLSSLKGIEYFTNLNRLYCNRNQLTSLDLSGNTNLQYLFGYENQLTSLDLSANTNLLFLNCCANQLTSLDLSNNINLRELHCQVNKITELDLSNNKALKWFTCNPMNDENGNNLLTNIYVPMGHQFVGEQYIASDNTIYLDAPVIVQAKSTN